MKKFSIIIPSRNEEFCLPILLKSIIQQDFALEIVEVIVLDNGSTDSTSHVVRQFSENNPGLKISYIYNVERVGMSFARNMGARYSQGEVLIFLDADNFVQESFLKNIFQKCFKEGYKAGTINLQVLEPDIVGKIVFYFLEKIKTTFKRPFGKSFVSRDVFDSVGGFNEKIHMGTNLDFLIRVKNHLKKDSNQIGHIKTPIYTCLRRFKRDGYFSILFRWSLAYLGLKKIPYK